MYVEAINHRREYGVDRFKGPGFRPVIIIFSLWGIILQTTPFKVAPPWRSWFYTSVY